MRPFVIVSVSDEKKDFPIEIDVEVPTDVPASKLAEDILEVMKSYFHGKGSQRQAGQLYSKRLGRALKTKETFGEAGVWMGDTIILK